MSHVTVINEFRVSPWDKQINELIQSKVMKMDYRDNFIPSSDMNDVMLVEEKMHSLGFRFLLKRCGVSCGQVARGNAEIGDYFCNIIKDAGHGEIKESYVSIAKTPSEAMCLSALKAVGAFL